MNGYVTSELTAARVRMRKTMLYSVGAHLILVLWLLLVQNIAPEEEGITEITWIDPVAEIQPAELPPIMAKAEPAPKLIVPKETPSVDKKQEHFQRSNPISTVAPRPQETEVARDRFSERLAALQDQQVEKPRKISSLTTPAPTNRKRLAGVDTQAKPRRPVELSRQGTPTTTPVELKRSPRRIQKSSISMATIPDTDVRPTVMKESDSTAQRDLAGALLTGPVADRPLLNFRKPDYPEWAKDEGVEGSVTIYFVVLPDGRIKENIMLQKTSGFSDFDDNAINALKTWRFEPLKGGATGEQWGTITFHYRLADF
jgi:TonB family protein